MTCFSNIWFKNEVETIVTKLNYFDFIDICVYIYISSKIIALVNVNAYVCCLNVYIK